MERGPAPSSWSEVLAHLAGALGQLGLCLRGGFAIDPASDQALLARFPGALGVMLVGNVGRDLWEKSGEAISKRAGRHRLNDWVRASLDPIASDVGAGIVFDFEGPPYFAFQQWARRAEPVHSSPLGILIHPEHGLWHAYRAALIFFRDFEAPPRDSRPSPCATCRDRPCLHACPVQAFDGSRYDVDRCRDHVLGEGEECRRRGCLARLACPIGPLSRYNSNQMSFHMDAFIASLKNRGATR